MASRRVRQLLVLVAAIVVVVLVGLVQGRGNTPSPPSPPTTVGHTVATIGLPPEARHTLELIKAGGPYPYREDDSVFRNAEGLLPAEPRGYYREYTVVTPGSPDRGARRIIAGSGHELYYTDDHYGSFRRIEGSP